MRAKRVGNTFSIKELRALRQMYTIVMRGGDAREVARSQVVGDVMIKFGAMEQKATEHDEVPA